MARHLLLLLLLVACAFLCHAAQFKYKKSNAFPYNPYFAYPGYTPYGTYAYPYAKYRAFTPQGEWDGEYVSGSMTGMNRGINFLNMVGRR
ncbi:hypothetical protein AAVH_38756 [Aphelenchoides avenae]|nr:hypothetical protein AAVH_38756 [Aphelenchus avenae]